MRIMFDDWTPDREGYEVPCTVAENVWPVAQGFEPALDYSDWGLFSPATLPNSSYGTRLVNGNDLNVLGASTAIYDAQRTTVPSRTSLLGLTTTKTWDFTTFSDFIIAVTEDQAPIAADLTNSPLQDFVLVTGGPPSGAGAIGLVRDFVVLGNTLESGTNFPNRVRWSGFNNKDIWGSDLSTQTDFQDLQGQFGPIQRIIPGSFGYIFQQSAIWRMTYVGPPVVFRFDDVTKQLGTPFPKSVIWSRNLCFFYSNNGFQMMDLGSGDIKPIGINRVDNWFADRYPNISSGRAPQAAIDRRRKLVFWVFDDNLIANPTGSNNFNAVLIYQWEIDRWSYITGVETAVVGSFELNNDVTDKRDNSAIIVRAPTDSTSTYGFFDGFGTAIGDNVLDARLQTAFYGDDTALVYLDGVRPIVTKSRDPWTLTVLCAYQTNNLNNPAAAMTTGNIAINSIGRSDFRVNARYYRFVLRHTGMFDRIIGVEFDPRPSGGR